jgi:cell fate regulator YaaT (PSP1 superfamily)
MTEQITDKIFKIAGVRFRENWKVYDFDATDVDVAVGDNVIVNSERGLGFALVVRIKKSQAAAVEEPSSQEDEVEVEMEAEGQEEELFTDSPSPKGQSLKTMRKILRKATAEDIVKEEKNKEREAEAFSMAQDMIAERELPMKLIRVEYSFDASRATFFFFSETRIDFRELVKELAYKLKSRIEMRQIGVRDVARMIGGFGPCGRELCCSAFLKNFEPVSIRMAKKQEMVLNPAKISGVCGRLLCCLSYEYEMYDEIKKDVADMRLAAVKEKKEEEERRIAQERREAEERRLADDQKRQEERKKQQDERREKPKEAGQKAEGKHEKRRDAQQGRKAQPQAEQPRERQQQKPDTQQEQKAPQPQQEGEKPGKKKKRRFWRKKRKQGQGENKPQGPGGAAE